MEKPFQRNKRGMGERGSEKGGGVSLLLWKTRCFLVKILGEWGVKTRLKNSHCLEEGLSSLVGGKQTLRSQGSLLFTQTFQELGLQVKGIRILLSFYSFLPVSYR